jgi:DNA helicase HerA-like ATPase
MRGARKFKIGTIMITQTITGIDVSILQNIPLMIVLGGSDAYVNEVAKALNLTSEDVRWLTTALPPHMAGLTAKALVITGPIRRQAVIELELAVKGSVL